MKKIIFYALLLSLLYSSCKKDKLTKATQTGANTFSCKVNGVLFKPSESGGLFSSPPLSVYNYPFNGFTLLANFNGNNSDPTSKSIIINLSYLKTTGSYNLSLYPNAIYELSYAGGPKYYTNNTYTGIVNITRCDTVNQIYSGTFSFTAIDANTKKTVNVTDGRFDVKRQ